MQRRFEGKVFIITGGSSGIGRAAAVELAAEGASVVVGARREDMGENVVTKIRAQGGDAIFVRADVTDTASVENLVSCAVARYGRLDGAFNNAGIAGPAFVPTGQSSEAEWDRVMETNLKGVWRCMRYEIPEILKTGGGAIVNNSSDVGLVGSDLAIGAYVASKHGVVGLTRSAAIEYARQGLRVNAVCPALTDSEMLEPALAHPQELEKYVDARIPMGRIADASEIARTVLWLLSSDASFLTGQAIAVDGGALAK
jgi:NAD(P)-dependent dehydrogenase (short-subunit alcohol dehydrogenase family)